jgi:formate dehydrogenase
MAVDTEGTAELADDAGPTTTHFRTCPLCEATCGLEIALRGDEVVRIRGDRDDVFSHGFICPKGSTLKHLHEDPDRLRRPLVRRGDDPATATWEEVTWDEAFAEVERRLAPVLEQHGRDAVAVYLGNPNAHNLSGVFYGRPLLKALGTKNVFSASTVDQMPKHVSSGYLFGSGDSIPVPDLDRTDLLVILGANPLESNGSLATAPDWPGRLAAIRQRGGRVVVIDPRRTKTADAADEHVPIRPGTDAYLLAAMAEVLLHEDGLDRSPARRVARGVDAFATAVAPWTPERVAPVCGIPAASIRALARDCAAADGAALYCSTGVNMGPFGSLAAWFIQGLNLLTGNTDRAGGLLVPPGPFDVLALSKAMGHGTEGRHRTLAAGWAKVAGAFPVGALADEITIDHPERIRGLVVSAGNPVHSVPGGSLADALDRLELLVCIDLYRNETAEHADFLLPAADMLERSDFPIAWANLQPTPHAQWTPAVVEPRAERRTEWQIFEDLTRACGAPAVGRSPLQLTGPLNAVLRRLPVGGPVTADTLLGLLLRWGRRTTLAELRANPGGVALPPTEPGSFLGRWVPTPDGLVDLAPRELLADLHRLAAQEAAMAQPPEGTLALIGRRERRSHNSWMHNNPGISQPAANTALLHPDDAERLGISDGAEVVVHGNGRTVRLPVKLTTDVAAGVVSVPHGWGHQRSGLTRARSLAGGNVNEVLAGGDAWMEPVSGQSIMLAQRVTVVRA